MTNRSLDIGFKVFRLTKSHFAQPEYSEDSFTDQMRAQQQQLKLQNINNALTEIALKNGFNLCCHVEHLIEFTQNNVHRIVDEEKYALLCLDADLHDQTLHHLINVHAESAFICRHEALTTTQRWTLWNILGSQNLRIV